MNFNLAINYAVRDEERNVLVKDSAGIVAASWTKTDRGITDQLLRTAIISAFPNGVTDKAAAKCAAGVQNALTRALAKGKDEIEISEDTFRWLWKIVSDWKVTPGWAHWYMDLYEVMEAKILEMSKNGTEAKKA